MSPVTSRTDTKADGIVDIIGAEVRHWIRSIKAFAAGAAFAAASWSAFAAPAIVEAHYSPTENLEKIDLELLASAHRTIDMAAYVLSDWVVIEALRAAEARGVTVRIVIDTGQHHAFDKLPDLADNIRVKRSTVFMHLKSYVVDGDLLRAGAANFSDTGLKRQDNDLIIIRDAAAVHSFDREFARMWEGAKPLFEHDRAMTLMDTGR